MIHYNTSFTSYIMKFIYTFTVKHYFVCCNVNFLNGYFDSLIHEINLLRSGGKCSQYCIILFYFVSSLSNIYKITVDLVNTL